MQSQQLPTESQVFEDEVLSGTENADQPAEEMSERHDHGKNFSGKVRIEPCAKSVILQVYDVLARHRSLFATITGNRSTCRALCAAGRSMCFPPNLVQATVHDASRGWDACTKSALLTMT